MELFTVAFISSCQRTALREMQPTPQTHNIIYALLKQPNSSLIGGPKEGCCAWCVLNIFWGEWPWHSPHTTTNTGITKKGNWVKVKYIDSYSSHVSMSIEPLESQKTDTDMCK